MGIQVFDHGRLGEREQVMSARAAYQYHHLDVHLRECRARNLPGRWLGESEDEKACEHITSGVAILLHYFVGSFLCTVPEALEPLAFVSNLLAMASNQRAMASLR